MTEHDGTFNDLKEAFTTGPILVFPDTMKPLWVEADASGHATGAILSMLCDDEKWRPCAHLLKSLNDVE
jgi:hypothetical protein